MARGKTAKLYRTFTKGLITEAGFLTYPENASTNELNTVISIKGNRVRRKGFTPESADAGLELSASTTFVTSEFDWTSVANRYDISFQCVQVGSKIHFFNSNSNSVISTKKAFVVDLQNYRSPTATEEQVGSTPCQMDAGKGFLFVVNEYMDPVVIEYNPDTDMISVVRVVIQIRDFDGVNDSLPPDAEPTELTNEHHYNLQNQGWVAPGSVQTEVDTP